MLFILVNSSPGFTFPESGLFGETIATRWPLFGPLLPKSNPKAPGGAEQITVSVPSLVEDGTEKEEEEE